MAKARKKKPTPTASTTPKRSFSKPAPAAAVPQAITEQSIDQENNEPAPSEPKKEIKLDGVVDVIGAINELPKTKPESKADQSVSRSKAADVYKDVKPSNLIPPFMANRKK